MNEVIQAVFVWRNQRAEINSPTPLWEEETPTVREDDCHRSGDYNFIISKTLNVVLKTFH